MSANTAHIMPVPDRRIDIDLCRAAAIVGVLVLHSGFSTRLDPAGLALQADLSRLFDWAVLAFFFASGATARLEDPPRGTWMRRAVLILGCFCIYNVLYNAVFALVAAYGFLSPVSGGGNSAQPGDEWFLWPFDSPGFQLYFLPYLFLISTLFHVACSQRWWGPRMVAGACFVGAIAYYGFIGYPTRSHGSSIELIPLYAASYSLGTLFARQGAAWSQLPALPVAVACAAIAAALILVPHPLISLAVAPLLLLLLKHVPAGRCSGTCAVAGKWSGSVYLWHTPLIMPLLSRGILHDRLSGPLGYVLLIVSTLAVCLALRLVAEKASRRITGRAAPRILTL